jgi:hypothetical protein
LRIDEDVSEDIKTFQPGRTYFHTAGVSSHAELNLNGSYLVQLELSREEIARLFYLTHRDAELPQLIKFFLG